MLAFAVLLGTGCAINPATQRPVVLALTEREESDMGRAGLAVLSVSPGLWVDDVVTPQVQRLGAKVGSIAPGPSLSYEFYVLDTDEKNAFALPGGYVFISRGLLAILESEDELVAALAHEVGHVAARHASRRAVLYQGYEWVNDATQAVAELFDLDVAQSDGFMSRALASHSRSQELEADRIGVVLAVSLGYDGTALADLLTRLETDTAPSDSILDTHPSTPERRRLIQAFAPQLAPGPGRPELTRDSFVRQLDGLPMGPSAALGQLANSRYYAPGLTYTAQFPPDWDVKLSLDGPVASAPDWQALISIYDATGSIPPEGTSRTLGDHRIFMRIDDGMQSQRVRITVGGRDLEVAGLWSGSGYESLFDSVVLSLKAPKCDEPVVIPTLVIEIQTVHETLARRIVERDTATTPS
ncbi:MAG: M48 family metalloprotease, partial [Myxococcota bacterium]